MMALKPQPSWVELAKQIGVSTEISLRKRWTDMRKCAGRKFAKKTKEVSEEEVEMWFIEKRPTKTKKLTKREEFIIQTWENSLTEREDLAEAAAAVLSKKIIQREELWVMD